MRTTDVLGEYHRFADLSVFSSISGTAFPLLPDVVSDQAFITDSGPWHYRVAARYLYGTDALQQEPLRAHKLINRGKLGHLKGKSSFLTSALGEISTLLKVQGLTDHWLERYVWSPQH